MELVVGIDVGKTNIRVGVFRSDLTAVERWATGSADVPSAQIALRNHLRSLMQRLSIKAVGLSIFGPLRTNPMKTDYGAIIESSEPPWSDVNIPALASEATGLPVSFDFDVNAGALAEATVGAGKGLGSFVYLSVGTGIGGVFFRDRLLPGSAPQLGHMYIPREEDDREFAGSCRFHGCCLQGLASGKAIKMRWGRPAEELRSDDAVWDLEARYLARACANLVYTFAPELIVLGSTIGAAPGLSLPVDRRLRDYLNDFLEPSLRSLYAERHVVVPAQLGPDASIIGAVLLAQRRAGLLFRP